MAWFLNPGFSELRWLILLDLLASKSGDFLNPASCGWLRT